MPGLDKMLDLLPGLTGPERVELMAHLKPLMQFSSKDQLALPLAVSKSNPANSDCDLVLDSIRRVLQGMGVEFFPVARLRATPGFSTFENEKVPGIMQFIRSGAMKRVQHIALLDLGVSLLYGNMQQMGIAVSSRAILSHAHRIPSVINQAFPGYAQSGKLGMIVRQQYVKDTGAK